MTKPKLKPRSETTESNSGSNRPISRASTASVHTVSEQTNDHSRRASDVGVPAAAYASTNQPSYYPQPQSSQSLVFPPGSYAAESSQILPQQNAPPNMPQYSYYGQQAPSAIQAHMQERDDTPFTSVNPDDDREDSIAPDGKQKKGSNTNIANERELRRIFQENKHRSLRDIAVSVLAEERGPKSEKTKQIFAMMWLNLSYERGDGSIPRGRVFQHYATRCGNERVPTLNPASFGKLVRVIFPGIQTRRLGMRGESKYNYVDLRERKDVQEEASSVGASLLDIAHQTEDHAASRRSRLHVPADTAVFPSPTEETNLAQESMNAPSGKGSKGYLFLDPHAPTLTRAKMTQNLMSRHLQFPTRPENSDIDGAIQLPSIDGYLPRGTDPDAANCLAALFRTHCIAVIDAFRFCKEKVLYHAFTSFHGTLTVPVQKLLAHPDLAEWIKACDWTMYQKIGAYASSISLTVIPAQVLPFFKRLTTKLSQHIYMTFQHLPEHVRDARHGPAVMFCSLLDRCLRVNATAHAAANLLESKDTRDQMWMDWATYVQPSAVVETSLDGVGYTRTLQILTTEMRELLEPLNIGLFPNMQPIYHDALTHRGIDYLASQANIDLDQSGILDRWQRFVESLPNLFPNVPARTLIDYVSQVGAAAIRDLTIANAPSFGTWWVTKTFIDEMLLWQAEKGGFLERSPVSTVMRPQKRSAGAAGFDEDASTFYNTESQHRSNYPAGFGRSDFRDGASFPVTFASPERPERSTAGPIADHHDSLQHLPYYQMDFTETSNDPNLSRGGVELASKVGLGSPLKTPSYNNPFGDPNEGEGAEAQSGHDDSGIGLEPELPASKNSNSTSIRLNDYGAYVGDSTTASDPANVVVC